LETLSKKPVKRIAIPNFKVFSKDPNALREIIKQIQSHWLE